MKTFGIIISKELLEASVMRTTPDMSDAESSQIRTEREKARGHVLSAMEDVASAMFGGWSNGDDNVKITVSTT